MTMQRDHYPADWDAISLSIRRDRAHWQCERCGARQGALTERSVRLGLPWKVVLTVAHLGAPRPDGSPGDKHDKLDCRPENLQALCQRCHLKEDLADHVAQAHETRRRKQEQTGQLVLFACQHQWDDEVLITSLDGPPVLRDVCVLCGQQRERITSQPAQEEGV